MIRLRLKTETNAFVPAINEEETFLLTFFEKKQPWWNFYAAVAENRERNCRVSTSFSNRHGLYILIFTFYCSNDLSTGRSTCLRIACTRIILVSNNFNFLTHVTGKWSMRRMISSRVVKRWKLNEILSNIDQVSLNYFSMECEETMY